MHLQKPEPWKKTKARKKRAEAVALRAMYEHCDARDGYCRFRRPGCPFAGECSGRTTLQHLKKRSLTRNQAPEVRHDPQAGIKQCEFHHKLTDDHDIKHEYLEDSRADGRMRFTHRDGTVWTE